MAMKPIKSMQLAFTLALCTFMVVPVALSACAGLSKNAAHGLRDGLTLRWLAQVWSLYHQAIWLSLLVALATCLIALAVGIPAGYVLARSRHRVARIIEDLLMLPVAVPGLASALALLTVYGNAGAFRNSAWFIVTGHVVFTLPFMVRSVAAVCTSIDLATMEEGAASLGAPFWQRAVTVVLPNIHPGIVAGALTVVTLSLGEFNLTWMLHTPLTQTLPVGLADAYASMRIEVASAYTVIFFIILTPILVLMQACGTNGIGAFNRSTQ
jgi:putative spermidine/putrescine transport system permease protein